MQTTFNTSELLNASIKTCKIGNWDKKILYKDIVINENEKYQLEDIASGWPSSFHNEHCNLMTSNFGVPSCIIRFDYIVDSTGSVRVFEIEERPAGLEISAMVNPQSFDLFIKSIYQHAEFFNKPFGLCVSPGRMFNSDDYYWIQRLKNLNHFRFIFGDMPKNPEENIWLVRSLRSEEKYFNLTPFSLSTIQYEGDKSYGVGMGLWKRLDYSVIEEITWNEPFVLKPDAGCRCENVHLFHPRKPSGGFSTRTKVEHALREGHVKYIQPYYAPEAVDFLPEKYSLMRRCFLVFDIDSRSYKVIGGVWESRPGCHKIHGASDAVCGPLVL